MGSEVTIEELCDMETDGLVNFLAECCGEEEMKLCLELIRKNNINGAHIYSLENATVLCDFLKNLGVVDIQHINVICDLLAQQDSKYCRHVYLECWDGVFHCVDCKMPVTAPPDRIKRESEMERSVRNRDEADIASHIAATSCSHEEAVGYLSSHRGVTIQFLVDFTRMNNLWTVPTWKVRRDYILPATDEGRLRYVELPHMAGSVGQASTFVSHTWSAPWGDLVAAVSDGADRTRRIWVDLFAVRQWPGSIADLDFRSTIRCCSSFMLVCTSLPEVARLSWSRYDRYLLSEETKKKIAFFRVWCLVEIQTAVLSPGAVIIMKGGSHEAATEQGVSGAQEVSGDVRFVSNKSMLEKMKHVIDVANADASVPSDKERILREVENGPGGARGLNRTIKGTVGGALACCGDSTVQCAACGDAHAMEAIWNDGRSITRVAAGGYHRLLATLIHKGADVEVRDEDDMTPLMWSCYCGHKECVRVLLEAGADPIHPRNSRDGMSAFLYACDGGHVECVESLLRLDKDHELCSQASSDGTTAVMFACFAGRKKDVTDLCKLGPPPGEYRQEEAVTADENYTRCLELILAAGKHTIGFDVNKINDMHMTALMCAAVGGHMTELRMLLGAGADVHLRNDQGVGAAVIAREHGHLDCYRLLAGEWDQVESPSGSCVPYKRCLMM